MAYTTIDDPSAHFQTTLYTGNGSDDHAITNGGNSDLQSDLLWFKERANAGAHSLHNSTNNVSLFLESNTSGTENYDTTTLKSIQTDGFTLGTESNHNQASTTYVAWQWKANGGTRTTFSESGNNPAGGYQANTTGGFSIVDYTGTQATGTVAHGLGAVPKMIIVKDRDAARSWSVYHHQMGSPAVEKNMHLNTKAAVTDYNAEYWGGTNPTTSVFSLGNAHDINYNNRKYIAYCFAEKQGYSKFGSYVANANTNGPFVYTGFKPAWIMVKNTSRSGYAWSIIDNKRDTFNEVDNGLEGDAISAEFSSSANYGCDFLSNGFKVRSVSTGYLGAVSGDTLIYMAFAESPFVTSTGTPTTAR